MVSAITGAPGQVDWSAMKQMRQQLFSKIDSNGDGQIDQSELAAAVPTAAQNAANDPGATNLFKALDTNGDGSISQDELKSGMAKLHHHHHPNMAKTLLDAQEQSQGGASSALADTTDPSSDTATATAVQTTSELAAIWSQEVQNYVKTNAVPPATSVVA